MKLKFSSLEDLDALPNEDAVLIYGQEFLRRLQEHHPERKLIGRLIPCWSYEGTEEDPRYIIGEETTIKRKGLIGTLFRLTEPGLRFLVEFSDYSLTIYDPQIRRATEIVVKELEAVVKWSYARKPIDLSNKEEVFSEKRLAKGLGFTVQ